MLNTSSTKRTLAGLLRHAAIPLFVASLAVVPAPGANHESKHYKTWRAGAAKAAKEVDSRYQPVRLEVPDSVGGVAIDINNRGTVAGVYFDAAGGHHTFLYDRGEYRKIIAPNVPVTSVPSITYSGRLLFGNWGTSTKQQAGTFNLRTGSWTPLPDYPGKSINIGNRMNNAGIGVGQACEGTFEWPVNCVAWIWNGKGYEPLQIPNTTEPVPLGINDRGQIVGLYLETPPFGFRAFSHDRGETTILLPNTDAVAYDLNNQGEVAMLIEVDPRQLFVPAVYEKSASNPELLPLYPGSLQTLWQGMNERGDFVGFASVDFASPPFPVMLLRK